MMTSPTSLPIDINTVVTDAVIEEYWERGYWISPRLFDDGRLPACARPMSGSGQATTTMRFLRSTAR